MHGLDAPALLHELRGEPVEQFRLGRRRSRLAEISHRLHERGLPVRQAGRNSWTDQPPETVGISTPLNICEGRFAAIPERAYAWIGGFLVLDRFDFSFRLVGLFAVSRVKRLELFGFDFQ